MARKKDRTLLIGLGVAGVAGLAFWKWQSTQAANAAAAATTTTATGTTTLAQNTTMPGTAADTTPMITRLPAATSVATQAQPSSALANAITAGRLSQTATASTATSAGFGLLR